MSSSLRSAVTPHTAKIELAKRRLAQRHLLPFAAYVSPWYDQTLAHLQSLADELEQVELFVRTQGKEGNGRLIIMMPPQHGKTETVSRHFPAWAMGRNPDFRFILTGYNADRATKNSRAVRQLVTSPKFEALFGKKSKFAAEDEIVQISDDSRAKASWNLAAPHRGSCMAAGVGGGITGEPADVIIIDDPHKDRDEVMSPTQRAKVVHWWNSVIQSRITVFTAVVIVHTRWDPDDLIGSRLKLMATGAPNVDKWKILCLPAIAMDDDQYAADAEEQAEKLAQGVWLDTKDPLGRKAGEALWAERHPASHLATARANDEFEWWALYMQQPRPLSGGFFEREDCVIVDAADVPEGLRWYRYVDLAISESSRADYNATVAGALDGETGNVYYRDMLRLRGWIKFRPLLIAAMLSDLEQGTIWGLEKVAFQSLAFQELARDPQLASVSMYEIVPEGNKRARAQPLRFRGRSGKVKLVRGAWTGAFIDEALMFTGDGSGHDDQIDSASGDLKMIAEDQFGTDKAVSSQAMVVEAQSMFV